MLSSTSSSENAVGTVAALRTAVAATLLLAAALAFARCQIIWIEPIQAEKKRLREAIEALPAMAARPGPTAVFFGSSLVWNGFSPVLFDERLREQGIELATFNLGFGGLNPEIQLLLTRRMRRAFDANGSRLKLVLVEWNPFQSTQTRHRGDDRVREQHLMMLSTPGDLFRTALSSPERGARFFASRVFRASMSPEAVTSALGGVVDVVGQLVGDSDPSELGPSPDLQEARKMRGRAALDFGIRLYGVYGGFPPMWEFEHRGDMQMDFPETHESLVALSTTNDWDLGEDLAMRIRCCDILELRFEEALLSQFVEIVHEFQQFSDRVEIVLAPVNHAWVKRSPAAEERLRAAIERIRVESGAPIVDLQRVPGIDPSHFWDVTHLNYLEGRSVFSVHLADLYGPSLLAQ